MRDGGSKCEAHRVAWQKRSDAPQRMRGRALQDARARLFRRAPLCVECELAGRVTLATQRDHVLSLGEGGLDVDSNTQGLCDVCHEAKTEAERRRGIERN